MHRKREAHQTKQTDAAFVAAYLRSLPIVDQVAAEFARHGHDPIVPNEPLRKCYEERDGFADLGDILLPAPDELEPQVRVEVKQRFLAFSSAEGYPYPTVLLGETYQHVRSPDLLPAFGFVVVNEDATGFLWVPASTRPTWTIHRCIPRNTGKKTESWAVRTGQTKYYPLPAAPIGWEPRRSAAPPAKPVQAELFPSRRFW